MPCHRVARLVLAALFAAAVAQPVLAQSTEGLTQKQLGSLLGSMGLQPKLDSQRYDFQFEAVHQGRKWTLSMSTVLSANGKSVWIMAWLDELPRSATDVPRTALLRLLADNDRLGRGKFFAYVPANRRFVLQRTIPNQGLNAAKFRDALQDLGGGVADTYSHWNVAGWVPKSAAAPGEKPVPRPPIPSATRDASKFRDTARN